MRRFRESEAERRGSDERELLFAGPTVQNFATTAIPKDLRELEIKAVQERRELAGEAPGDPERDAIGLALSGGGIRSATFCIGVLQELARSDRLKKIDYLSTVSGGGYCGSFLGRLYTRAKEGEESRQSGRVKQALDDPHSPAIRWLRDCGRYLAPAGSSDARLAMAVVLRNWITVMWVVGLFLFAFFSFGAAIRQLLWSRTSAWSALEAWLILHAGQPIWWSPLLGLTLVPLFLAVIPLGWAYWFTQTRRTSLSSAMPFYCTFVAVLASAAIAWSDRNDRATIWWVALGVGLTGSLAIAYWGLSLLGRKDDGHLVSRSRNRLSRGLSDALLVSMALAAAGAIDSLGQTIFALLQTKGADGESILSGKTLSAIFASLAPLVAAGRYVVDLLPSSEGDKAKKSRLPLSIVAAAAAFLIAAIGLTALDVASHAFLWRGATPRVLARISDSGPRTIEPGKACANAHQPKSPAVAEEAVADATAARSPDATIWIAFSIAALVSALIGKTYAFLNLSSYQGLYGARLTRAYLGASNPARIGPNGVKVTETIAGDDEPFLDYRPDRAGGPLHIVNVTLNETIDGRSEIEQKDRKGLPMALGPLGISVGVRHHALWPRSEKKRAPAQTIEIHPLRLADPNEYSVFPPRDPARKHRPAEALTIGSWMGISGAAFTTGLGSRTSLSLSLLCGVANVRLGYWFDSGITATERSRHRCDVANPAGAKGLARFASWLFAATIDQFFPVQVQLLEEFLARFHGPARRRWYLSDGGHFENTACYELLRRRVPFIICCDDGADPDYSFTDAAALVRLARTDFHAEIEFLDAAPFGPLADIKRTGGKSHAALAAVRYDGKPEPETHILFLKPSVTGDEPLDVLEYQRAHAQFPQEPTSDQFFDEAQWESYRILGKHVAETVLNAIPKAKWMPAQF
jgi:hypothetical protein